MTKKIYLLILCCFVFILNSLTAQTYCLTFRLERVGGGMAQLTLGIAAGGTPFKLGASNLQFRYKHNVLGSPRLVSNALTATTRYNGISITTPSPQILAGTGDSLLSFNFNYTGNTGSGFAVPLLGVDIAVIEFRIKSGDSPFIRNFENGNAGTIVYNDDVVNPLLISPTSNCPVYDVILNTNNLNPTPRPKVYPNPTQDILNIENADNKNFEIINALGRVVLNGNYTTPIDIQNLSKGYYLLKINSTYTKFIKL